jgi:hypothetical protein
MLVIAMMMGSDMERLAAILFLNFIDLALIE